MCPGSRNGSEDRARIGAWRVCLPPPSPHHLGWPFSSQGPTLGFSLEPLPALAEAMGSEGRGLHWEPTSPGH